MFLVNRDYTRLRKSFFSGPFSSTRVVYSSSQWINKAKDLSLSTPFWDSQEFETEHSIDSINNNFASAKNNGIFKRLPLQTTSSLEGQETLKKPCIGTQEQTLGHCMNPSQRINGNTSTISHELCSNVLGKRKKLLLLFSQCKQRIFFHLIKVVTVLCITLTCILCTKVLNFFFFFSYSFRD
jgi:hypothetical protein